MDTAGLLQMEGEKEGGCDGCAGESWALRLSMRRMETGCCELGYELGLQ